MLLLLDYFMDSMYSELLEPFALDAMKLGILRSYSS